jgi:hypothetical protein
VRAGVKLAAGPVDRFGTIDALGYIEQGHRILAAREPFAPEDLVSNCINEYYYKLTSARAGQESAHATCRPNSVLYSRATR